MIGILIISHGNLGDSLIHCANHVRGEKSKHLASLSITPDDDPDVLSHKAMELAEQLDQGDGVSHIVRYLRGNAMQHSEPLDESRQNRMSGRR